MPALEGVPLLAPTEAERMASSRDGRRKSTALTAMEGLKSAMAEADATGVADGALDAHEASTLDPALYERLGLSNATELINSFDKDGNGQLDAFERVDLLRALLATVKPEMKELAASYRWDDAEAVRQARLDMRSELKAEEANSWAEETTKREQVIAQVAHEDLRARKKAWAERKQRFDAAVDKRVEDERTRYEAELLAIDAGATSYLGGRYTGPRTPKLAPDELVVEATMTQCATNERYAQAASLREEHSAYMGLRTNELNSSYRERQEKLRRAADARHKAVLAKLADVRNGGHKKLGVMESRDIVNEQRKHLFRFKAHKHVHEKIRTEASGRSSRPNADARMPALPVEPNTEQQDLRDPVRERRPRTVVGRMKEAYRLEKYYNDVFFSGNDGGMRFRPNTATDLEWLRRGRIPRIVGTKPVAKLVPTVSKRVIVPPIEFQSRGSASGNRPPKL